MSEQERVSWVSLVINLVIGWLYFSHVFSLPASTDLFGPSIANFAMDKMVLNLIILALFVGIATEVLLKYYQKRARDARPDATALDERDVLINLKSMRNGFYVLVGCVVVLLVQVTLIERTARELSRRGRSMSAAQTVWEQVLSGPLSAPVLAHLLLLALTLAGIAVYVSRIVQYRRGY